MASPQTTSAEPPGRGEGAAVGRLEETTTPGASRRLISQPGPSAEQDSVEEAGQGSFPGSDPPSWSGAIAR